MGAQCSDCVARSRFEASVDSHLAMRTSDGRRQLLQCHVGEHPSEGYEVSREVIGEGGFGHVRRLVSKKTKALGALKTISKDRVLAEVLKRELDICLRLDHPNIVRLFDVYEDWQNVYMVFEFCGGGEVLDKLLERKRFSEADALFLLGQALHAINYIHAKQVAHRDVKLENMLLKDDVVDISQANLKIIDFGMARRFVPGKSNMTTSVGSAFYIAPEVVGSHVRYSEKCDIWSVGVVAYMLFCSCPPFEGDSQDEILSNVRHAPLRFEGHRWKAVSKKARDLIKSMIKRHVASRSDAREALAKWKSVIGKEPSAQWEDSESSPEKKESEDSLISDGDQRDFATPLTRTQSLPDDSFQRLQAFGKKNRFVKSARHLIARHLEAEHLNDLQSVFHKLDKDGDGMLTLSEVKEAFAAAGYVAKEIEQAFAHVDTDGSDIIEYTEFVAALMDKANCKREELCWEAFRVFDKDNDGHIGVDDLRKTLQIMDRALPYLSAQEAEDLIQDFDKDGDHRISFHEFIAMMERTAETPAGEIKPRALIARPAVVTLVA